MRSTPISTLIKDEIGAKRKNYAQLRNHSSSSCNQSMLSFSSADSIQILSLYGASTPASCVPSITMISPSILRELERNSHFLLRCGWNIFGLIPYSNTQHSKEENSRPETCSRSTSVQIQERQNKSHSDNCVFEHVEKIQSKPPASGPIQPGQEKTRPNHLLRRIQAALLLKMYYIRAN